MEYCFAYTLTNNEEEAKKIAHALIREKLAAGCNIIKNVTSIYEWKGELREHEEFLIMAKTRKDLFEEAKNSILKNHSYELPAIVMLPIETGLPDFLSWISENTKQV